MQKAQLFGRISRRAERGLQTQQLPLENFIVMTAVRRVLFKEPAARAGQGDAVIEIAVVIQQIQVRKVVFLAEAVEFRGRRPPVIVISLDDDLPPRNGGDHGKILARAVQVQRPGQVPEQDGRVLRPDDGQAFAELVHIADPRAAEDVHRLVAAEGKMQVSNRVKGHPSRSFHCSSCRRFRKKIRSSRSAG